MKKINILLLIGLWMGILSCQQQEESATDELNGKGALRLELPTMQSESTIPVIWTKGAFGLDARQFCVQIWQQTSSNEPSLYKSFDTYQQMINEGMPLVLPIGHYQVKATSYLKATNETGVNEMPWFEGKRSEERRVGKEC